MTGSAPPRPIDQPVPWDHGNTSTYSTLHSDPRSTQRKRIKPLATRARGEQGNVTHCARGRSAELERMGDRSTTTRRPMYARAVGHATRGGRGAICRRATVSGRRLCCWGHAAWFSGQLEGELEKDWVWHLIRPWGHADTMMAA